MPLDRDAISQLRHLIRPLATRIANIAARAVVHIAEDGKKLQLLQLGVLAGETIEGAEHHQPYGFSSVPLGGAEAVVLFPNGDRSHPLVTSVSDRRYRPVGGVGGEVCMYTDEGDVIRLGRGHVISLVTSGQVKLGSAAAAEGAVKGTQRNTAEQTFLTALATFATAIVAVPTPAKTAFLTAITAFQTAVAAAVSAKVLLE